MKDSAGRIIVLIPPVHTHLSWTDIALVYASNLATSTVTLIVQEVHRILQEEV